MINKLFLIIALAIIVFNVSCFESPSSSTSSIPVLTTKNISSITFTTARSGGNITSNGGSTITARGVCWSTAQTPTISDDHTTNGTGTGDFVSDITGLSKATIYYVRAYATNNIGTGYGNILTFKTDCSTGTVTDIDGNEYQTVIINDQVWMGENLKVTHYRNGDAIPKVTDSDDWTDLNSGAYCVPNNDENNVATYGLLYNWYAVRDMLAPAGWHIPTDSEWKQLEMYLGMSQSGADGTGLRGTDEGGMLKENGTSHWKSPNTGATNSSCFSAVPSGNRHLNGSYYYFGEAAYLWSDTGDDTGHALLRYLDYSRSDIGRYNYDKRGGYSVRCVMD